MARGELAHRDPAPLATEALRGDGAVLTNAKGVRFMPRYHEQGELAPRDDVARAIFAEIEAGRQPYLDCRKAVGSHFPDEFPTVFESCMSAGIDPRTQLNGAGCQSIPAQCHDGKLRCTP